MTAALLDRKYTRRFSLLDQDRDGLVNRDDYVAVADRLVTGRGIGNASMGARSIRESFAGLWCAVAPAPAGSLGTGEFTAAMHGLVAARPDGFDRSILRVTQQVLGFYDSDGDGELSRAEFGALFRAKGVAEHETDEAFARIDRDGNGSLSVAEIGRALREFYTSSDPRVAGNWLFGEF